MSARYSEIEQLRNRLLTLECIVQALHGDVGHDWRRGDATNHDGRKKQRACVCGAREWVSLAQWEKLPEVEE